MTAPLFRSGNAPSPEPRRRVALVIASLSDGGAERVTAALARHWTRAGHEVGVVTISASARDTYQLAPGVQRIALDLLRPSRNAREAIVNASRRVVAIRLALAALDPEVVVSLMTTTNVLTLCAASSTGVPVLVCERSDPRHDPLPRPWAALRRALYPRAAGVVVQTRSVAAWARGLCERVHVVPNFVERPPCAADPGIGHGPRQLIAMGRLGPEKGFDLLIEAFARVAHRHPTWSLTILGEGAERRRLEALIRVHRLESRVAMPGRVADPSPHLAAAHGFALPSRYEGFPNALLEAMACGLPVVAFDCPSGPAEIVTHEEDGILVRRGDVWRFAEGLDRIMANDGERARMGRSASRIAARLAPERVLELWSALLRDAGTRA